MAITVMLLLTSLTIVVVAWSLPLPVWLPLALVLSVAALKLTWDGLA